MDGDSTWGAFLVAWLLIAPLIGIVVSSAWGGGHTSARVGQQGHVTRDRYVNDNAQVPPERVDYSQTAGERSVARDAMRDRDVRSNDGRGMPRH
jgi:hypothetical protein